MAETKRVPEWLLERLVANDLDPGTAERVRSRLAAHGELGRMQQLEVSNRALLAAHPAPAVVTEIERRLRTPGKQRPVSTREPSRWRWTWPALTVGVSLAVALLVTRAIWHENPSAPPSVGNPKITAKGLAPQLAIYRQREGGGAERLTADSRVRAGDVLQVAYVGAGRRYGVIASIDALGAVTLHLPEIPGSAAELEHGETPVPHAFELDDSPGFERFVFASSNTPFATSTLVEALRSGKLEAVSPSLELVVAVARKEPAP